MPLPTALDKWLKKATVDDTGLTRPPVAIRVSAHKDEVRSIFHGYFQSQFRVPVYKVVGRSRQDAIKREEAQRNCHCHEKRPPTTHPRRGGVTGSCDRKWG